MRYARYLLAVAIGVALIWAAFPAQVSYAQSTVLNYFAPPINGGTRDNILNIDGTLEFEDKATVLDHGTATLSAAGYASVTTNLSSVVTCSLGLVSTAPGDDPVMVTGLWTAGAATLELFGWKNTGGTDPTLIRSTTASVKVGYICAGAD